MVDSVLVFPPGFRVLDANGAPVNGAKIKFFEVGPAAAKNVFGDAALTNNLGPIVYTRSDGFPVTAFGGNTTTLIYVGNTTYYIQITDANDVALFPAKDNVRGAVDTSSFLTIAGGSILNIPNVTTAVPLTLTTAHKGKLIAANAALTLTLTAAATLLDGWNAEVKNDSASAYVSIASSDTIHTLMGSCSAFALGPGASCAIRCNGASFEIVGQTPAYLLGTGVLTIASRVAAVPGAPTAGARYIATAVFGATPVTTAVGDIIEATGQGTWFKVTPPTDCGWLAFVQDENAYYSFQDSAWAKVLPLPAATDVSSGIIELAVQSEMETATDVVRAVVPGRQHFHPGHPKAWLTFNGTGTPAITESYNVTSLTDNGTGNWTVNFTTAFNSAGYAVCGTARGGPADAAILSSATGSTKSTTACTLLAQAVSAAPFDSTIVCAAFFGDMP